MPSRTTGDHLHQIPPGVQSAGVIETHLIPGILPRFLLEGLFFLVVEEIAGLGIATVAGRTMARDGDGQSAQHVVQIFDVYKLYLRGVIADRLRRYVSLWL